MLEESIEPLVAGASLAANAAPPGEGAIYLVNCLLAVQVGPAPRENAPRPPRPLRERAACAPRAAAAAVAVC